MGAPHFSLFLNSIRRHYDGKPAEEVLAELVHFGIPEPCRRMVALVCNWRDQREEFVAVCTDVRADESLGLYWRARATRHIGAVSDFPEVRVARFNEAVALAKQIPGPDGRYNEYVATAGLMDTPGQTPDVEKLSEIVSWMVHYGTFDAPGRADHLIRLLVEADRRVDATRYLGYVRERNQDKNAFFSARQLERLHDTAFRLRLR